MDDSSSSSNYSASSLIKLAQTFLDQEQHIPHTTVPLSPSISIQQFPHSIVPSSPSASSNSSYGYESLLEATAACSWKPSLATQGSLCKKTPSLSQSSLNEDGGGRSKRLVQGVTTPEDVSLSDEDETREQPGVKPVKHFSTRDPRKRRSDPSSDESDVDAYEPPQRPPALQGPVARAQDPPPPATLSTYGDFVRVRE